LRLGMAPQLVCGLMKTDNLDRGDISLEEERARALVGAQGPTHLCRSFTDSHGHVHPQRISIRCHQGRACQASGSPVTDALNSTRGRHRRGAINAGREFRTVFPCRVTRAVDGPRGVSP